MYLQKIILVAEGRMGLRREDGSMEPGGVCVPIPGPWWRAHSLWPLFHCSLDVRLMKLRVWRQVTARGPFCGIRPLPVQVPALSLTPA